MIRPRWRKTTWALLLWTAPFAVMIIATVSNALSSPQCGSTSHTVCQATDGIGAAIVAVILLIIWAAGSIPLLIAWLAGRVRSGRVR